MNTSAKILFNALTVGVVGSAAASALACNGGSYHRNYGNVVRYEEPDSDVPSPVIVERPHFAARRPNFGSQGKVFSPDGRQFISQRQQFSPDD